MIEIPRNKLILILSLFLALTFLGFGGMKFTSPDDLLANFQAWGYPDGFHFVVGGLEVAGAIGLFIKPVARYAALSLSLLMVVALGTHVLNPPAAAGIPSLILGVLAFTAYALHTRAARS